MGFIKEPVIADDRSGIQPGAVAHRPRPRCLIPGIPIRAERLRFTIRCSERAQAIPGVRSAALVMNLPFSGGSANRGVRIEGRPEPKADENTLPITNSSARDTSHHGDPTAGRTTPRPDRLGKRPRVAIINQLMARKHFPGRIRSENGLPSAMRANKTRGALSGKSSATCVTTASTSRRSRSLTRPTGKTPEPLVTDGDRSADPNGSPEPGGHSPEQDSGG